MYLLPWCKLCLPDDLKGKVKSYSCLAGFLTVGGNQSTQRETTHASERIIKLHAEKPEASFQTQDFLAAICDSPANCSDV